MKGGTCGRFVADLRTPALCVNCGALAEEHNKNKYGVAPRAERTDRDGIVHASKGEMVRWEALRVLERAGQISGLRRQVRYPLEVNGVLICAYVADFVYTSNALKHPAELRLVVEDFKGCRTEGYRLKKRLMLAVYGIKILETGTRTRSRARSASRRRGAAGGK